MIMDHTNLPFFSHKIQVSNERTPPELYKEKKKCKYNEIVIYREINLILTTRSLFILCSGVSYFLIVPFESNRCMLLVEILVVSLNFCSKPSCFAMSKFSSDIITSKCTVVSSLCSL